MIQFISGALTAPFLILTLPLDYLKLQYQTSPSKPDYTFPKLLSRIVQEKFYGARHVYAGASVLWVGLPLVQGVRFATYQKLKEWKEGSGVADGGKKMALGWASVFGVVSGLCTSLLACPVEYALTQSQLLATELYRQTSPQFRPGLSRNSLAIMVNQLRSGAGGQLFQHLEIVAWREAMGSLLAFPVYEFAFRKICPNGHPEFRHFFGAGALAGLSYWILAYPYDMIRTRYQSNLTIKHMRPSNYFYRGYCAGVVRGTINGGLCFAFFETFLALGRIGQILINS